MRIALISPYSIGPMRGNITTVNRIERHLGQLGIETLVLPLDALSQGEVEKRTLAFSPDLVHAFHARYCGEVAGGLARRLGVPLVITTTGSDICDAALRDHPLTGRAMADAAAIVCFSHIEADEVTTHFPHVSGRITIVHQGAEPLAVTKGELFGIPEDDFVLLLPAALRVAPGQLGMAQVVVAARQGPDLNQCRRRFAGR